MIQIHFWDLFTFITIAFIAFSIILFIKNRKFDKGQELRLVLFYIVIVVLVRIVYFPREHVNGHIDTLKFDVKRILPFKHNFVPFIRLFEIYPGWKTNILGNILLFVPVGIIWPVCFKKLNSLWKTVLAGGGLSLCIEISQLLFYDRCTDVDDLILNTTGVFIGAMIYFKIKHKKLKRQNSAQNVGHAKA